MGRKVCLASGVVRDQARRAVPKWPATPERRPEGCIEQKTLDAKPYHTALGIFATKPGGRASHHGRTDSVPVGPCATQSKKTDPPVSRIRGLRCISRHRATGEERRVGLMSTMRFVGPDVHADTV